MYDIQISAAAESEIDSIGKWYDKRVKGLSFRFYNDLDKGIHDILKYPTAFGFYNIKRGIRKYSLKNFPYRVFYEIQGDIIHIIAIVHSARASAFTSRRLR